MFFSDFVVTIYLELSFSFFFLPLYALLLPSLDPSYPQDLLTN